MDKQPRKNIAVVLYSHPEFFPPVLNVIDGLSKVFDTVHVLSRNLKLNKWKYLPGVSINNSGKLTPIRNSELKPTWWKILSFLRFTRDFYKVLKSSKPLWVMCNDPISLWSFKLIKPLIGFPIKLWYHNHDISELSTMRKYSIGYFSVQSESDYLSHVDLFTIPSIERLDFFSLRKLKGRWIIFPNYPALYRTSTLVTNGWHSGENLKLIYQGRVSNEHGLEELLDFVKGDKSIFFTIVGPGDEDYVMSLRNKVDELEISTQVSILDSVSYGELQQITIKHHVGLAVNKPMNIQYSTGALASNKIYEYAASGLPIIYFHDKHYLKFLGKYSWAFSSDLTKNNLSMVKKSIENDYASLSRQARNDFESELNFESVFGPVINFISGDEIEHN